MSVKNSFISNFTSSAVFIYIKLFAISIVIIILGVYIGGVLFGKYSLDVLLDLKSDKSALEKRIVELKKENAALQKNYFELRQLDPDLK